MAVAVAWVGSVLCWVAHMTRIGDRSVDSSGHPFFFFKESFAVKGSREVEW